MCLCSKFCREHIFSIFPHEFDLAIFSKFSFATNLFWIMVFTKSGDVLCFAKFMSSPLHFNVLCYICNFDRTQTSADARISSLLLVISLYKTTPGPSLDRLGLTRFLHFVLLGSLDSMVLQSGVTLRYLQREILVASLKETSHQLTKRNPSTPPNSLLFCSVQSVHFLCSMY
jgi:hypothetical protein